MSTIQTRRAHGSIRAIFAPLGLLLVLGLSAAARAQTPATPIAITLGPSTTSIRWTLNTTVHTVHGTFKLKNGAFKIDPVTGNVTGQIVIDATSGESGDSSRDKRMHSAILESVQYPTITFRPTHVDGKIDLAAAGPVVVDGILNLHGQDHPMKLPSTCTRRATASHSRPTSPFHLSPGASKIRAPLSSALTSK